MSYHRLWQSLAQQEATVRRVMTARLVALMQRHRVLPGELGKRCGKSEMYFGRKLRSQYSLPLEDLDLALAALGCDVDTLLHPVLLGPEHHEPGSMGDLAYLEDIAKCETYGADGEPVHGVWAENLPDEVVWRLGTQGLTEIIGPHTYLTQQGSLLVESADLMRS